MTDDFLGIDLDDKDHNITLATLEIVDGKVKLKKLKSWKSAPQKEYSQEVLDESK
jgi:hypothetical protein